ncbi:uncharacterized protein K452DRAFT_95588 [Aplosporella prunicola CBS 121167]|uniref:Uncharacterized protein n=1 Tax=Aplosporella prunicola CBS 121167 TaxID=1176127 RepID=A0A6A6B1S3_9PEZI|nr:uncharacterized protein K452DRAFT_95588 [Aplosporella prunicola CBS 121167]KAF2138129.1 hypothetical protein K452DRAFT_95588 [Aplosporella prunicola CBS 121167]
MQRRVSGERQTSQSKAGQGKAGQGRCSQMTLTYPREILNVTFSLLLDCLFACMHHATYALLLNLLTCCTRTYISPLATAAGTAPPPYPTCLPYPCQRVPSGCGCARGAAGRLWALTRLVSACRGLRGRIVWPDVAVRAAGVRAWCGWVWLRFWPQFRPGSVCVLRIGRQGADIVGGWAGGWGVALAARVRTLRGRACCVQPCGKRGL